MRHAYGKEGKRVDYTPHTCMKCISANPGAGEHHGCPYKTFGEESLAAALGGLQIAPQKVRDIVDKAKAQHYQLACGMTFEAVHGAQIESGVQHPNQYFQESRKALGFGDGEEDGAGSPEKAEPVTPERAARGPRGPPCNPPRCPCDARTEKRGAGPRAEGEDGETTLCSVGQTTVDETRRERRPAPRPASISVFRTDPGRTNASRARPVCDSPPRA